MNTIERLQQEHAIYKQFFLDMKNRPRTPTGFTDYLKSKLYDVVERKEHLDKGEHYYHPDWKGSKEILFSIGGGENNPYSYLYASDEYIEKIVVEHRKTTLKRDLIRHMKMILKAYLKLGKDGKDFPPVEVPGLFEWCARLLKIMVEKKVK